MVGHFGRAVEKFVGQGKIARVTGKCEPERNITYNKTKNTLDLCIQYKTQPGIERLILKMVVRNIGKLKNEKPIARDNGS